MAEKAAEKFFILDGGISTELEAAGFKIQVFYIRLQKKKKRHKVYKEK